MCAYAEQKGDFGCVKLNENLQKVLNPSDGNMFNAPLWFKRQSYADQKQL